MYSFTPVADTSDVHIGFYIVAGLLTWAMIALVRDALQERTRLAVLNLLWQVPALGIVGLVVAFASYSDKPPRNEKVTATFEGFTAEVEMSKTGKVSSTEHRLYGSFRLPEGVVALRVSTDTPIPKQVILYKN